MAGGADVILIPEIPYDLERVAQCIRDRDKLGARFSIVVVAEGAHPKDGGVTLIEAAHGGHAERLGGIGIRCAAQLEELTGKETRYVVLGHLQRGGSPTAFDRTLATRFGGKAVELLMKGQFGKMVANHPPDLVPIPLGEVVGKTKTVPLDYDLLLTARALGVSLGIDVRGLTVSITNPARIVSAQQFLVLLLLQLVDHLDVIVGHLLDLLEALPLVVF